MTKPLGKGYMRRDGRGSLTSPGSLKMALGLTGLALSRSIFGVHDGFHLISHECCAIRHVLQLGPPYIRMLEQQRAVHCDEMP